MNSPAVPNLCVHCSADDCDLSDFLPFNCDRCNQVFCLQHRSHTKHLCPVINQLDVTVLICPLCAQRVRLRPNEDPNIAWDIHVNFDCDPSNYPNSTKKRFCPVLGCEETLEFSNTIRCKDCSLDHCLRHRFALNHKCSGPKKSTTGFPFIGVLRRSLERELAAVRSSNGSTKWGLSLRDSALGLRSSAEARMKKFGAATKQVLRKVKDGMVVGFGVGGGIMEEECIQCNARFCNVGDLIDHVEEEHEEEEEDDLQKSCGVVTIEGCPLCSKGFRDAVLLVEHVEKHGNTIS